MMMTKSKVEERQIVEKQLFHAVKQRNTPLICELIQIGANVNALEDETHSTPLHCALTDVGSDLDDNAVSKRCNVAHLLIQAGANHKILNKDGLTPLGCAAMEGSSAAWTMIMSLVETHRIAVDDPLSSPKDKSETLLKYAILQGNHKCTRWLLQMNASMEHMPFDIKVKAFGDDALVPYLLQNQGPAFDQNGKTSLHYACHSGNRRAVKSLAKLGSVSLSTQDREGNSPLHIACMTNSMELAHWLLEETHQHADPNKQNSKRWTPLHLAVQSPEGDDVANWLMLRGVNIFSKNNNGQTFAAVDNLHYTSPEERTQFKDHFKNILKAFRAIGKGRLDKLQDALAHLETTQDKFLCPAMVRDKQGNTMVIAAAASPNVTKDIMELLAKQKGADINAVNHDKNNAMHLAAKAGHLDVLKTLHAAGGNLLARDHNKQTVLHHACQGEFIFMMDWLIAIVGVECIMDKCYGFMDAPIQLATPLTIAHFIVHYEQPLRYAFCAADVASGEEKQACSCELLTPPQDVQASRDMISRFVMEEGEEECLRPTPRDIVFIE